MQKNRGFIGIAALILFALVILGGGYYVATKMQGTPGGFPVAQLPTLQTDTNTSISAQPTNLSTAQPMTSVNIMGSGDSVQSENPPVPASVVSEQSFGKSAGYTKSANAVYYNGSIVQGADPSTFIAIDDWYGKDAHTVYFRQYSMKGMSVYLSTATNSLSTIIGIDPTTFNVLTDKFVKDKNNVYEMSTQEPGMQRVGVDAPTFTVVSDVYEKDKNRVYDTWGDTLGGADPATFVGVNDSEYGKDSRYVWYRNSILSRANPATFTAMTLDPNKNDWLAKDSVHVWFGNTEIQGADPATFTLLNEYYAKDKAQVYFNGNLVVGGDPASFQVTTIQSCGANCRYDSLDSGHKYRNGEVVQSVSGAQSSVSGMSKYTDSDFGFSFWYPTGWTVTQMPLTPGSGESGTSVDQSVGATHVQRLRISGGSQQNNVDLDVVHFSSDSITVPTAGCTSTYFFDGNTGKLMQTVSGCDSPTATALYTQTSNTMGGLPVLFTQAGIGGMNYIVPLSSASLRTAVVVIPQGSYGLLIPTADTIVATDPSVATPMSVAQQQATIQAEQQAYMGQ